MYHPLALIVAQVLPYVAPIYAPPTAIDPVRARTLTATDWTIIAGAATPIVTMTGSLLHRYRKFCNAFARLDAVRPEPEPIVWVNTQSGIYYFKGERWYQKTRTGVLLTQRLAEQRGNRRAKSSTTR